MKIRVIALLLCAALLMSGFTGKDFMAGFPTVGKTVIEAVNAWKTDLGDKEFTSYSEMEYIRPDMDALRASYDAVCLAAREKDIKDIMDAVYDFYDEYDWFYTRFSLADLHYSADLTDTYWEREYNFCLENSTEVDTLLEQMYYALADSPNRDMLESFRYFGRGFFDDYEEDSQWDESYVSLLEREAALQSEYYALSSEALSYTPGTDAYYDACADGMAQVLVELIQVRQEMADYWGYEDYVTYAYDTYYYRDYTPDEMDRYLNSIRLELVDIYREMNATDAWSYAGRYCSVEDTFQFVRTAAENMGGTVWEAFRRMEAAGLYDIAYGENKYAASFETFLTSYGEPFVFLDPEQSNYDKLTFAHEFGHFCNDYACGGSYVGVDVLEFFSQGMEYLSLCYGEDTERLTRLKMADSLSTYIEQAAYARFEQQMYGLSEEELNVQALYDLYDRVALEYGFDSYGYDPREFVDVTHFYTNPMYVVSYIVSNDAAMQLYQMEQEKPGTGLALMEETLDTQESWFLAFVDSADLDSPFGAQRLRQVRRTFEDFLG